MGHALPIWKAGGSLLAKSTERRSTMLESYIDYLVNLARRAIERHDYVSFVGIDEQYCKITSYAMCVLRDDPEGE